MVKFYREDKKSRLATELPSSLSLTVSSLDSFGQGVAHLQGKPIFIAGALPTEQVTIQITQAKRHYAQATVKQYHCLHPQRVSPLCRYFNQCGGCQQQHIAIDWQRQNKAEHLLRFIKQQTQATPALASQLSGSAYGYRRRVRWSLRYCRKQQRLLMGFRQRGSDTLVDIEQCVVLEEALQTPLAALRATLNQLSIRQQLGHVEWTLADNGRLMVLRHMAPLSAADRQLLLNFAQQWQVSCFLQDNQQQLTQLTGSAPYYQLADLRLYFHANDFIQVNRQVNQQMVAQAMDWLALQSTDRVWDLFCGMGNFSLPIAKQVKQLTGVEGSADLVAMARYNAQQNQIANAQFFQHDLTQAWQQQTWAKQAVDKIILDPSRMGAQAVVEQLAQTLATRIVYVSCHPATLVRDSKILLAAGFRWQQVSVLDMFPQTAHLEAMALFVKVSE